MWVPPKIRASPNFRAAAQAGDATAAPCNSRDGDPQETQKNQLKTAARGRDRAASGGVGCDWAFGRSGVQTFGCSGVWGIEDIRGKIRGMRAVRSPSVPLWAFIASLTAKPKALAGLEARIGPAAPAGGQLAPDTFLFRNQEAVGGRHDQATRPGEVSQR